MSEAHRHEARRDWLSVSDIAGRLGVSATTVYGYIAAGELTAWDASRPNAKRKDYRIRPEWFDTFYAKRIVNAA